jgi:uncharacterized surface protein with fasciclin (FAS1) repeats
MKMEKYISILFFKKKIISGLILLVCSLGIFSSCIDSDNVGGNMYTFKDKMMGQFLKDSTNFSEFAALLDTTKVMKLLNTYGSYTCFAPNNDAMRKFYLLKGKKSLKDFKLDSLKIIAFDHIISGYVILKSNFTIGRMPYLTMSDRYIAINYIDGITYVNDDSQILQPNIIVHNGVIHSIGKVLNPTRLGVSEVISKDSTFTLFYKALVVTGLVDSIQKTKDEKFDPTLYESFTMENVPGKGDYRQQAPVSRKYGYTLLMEGNNTFKVNNINNIEDLKKAAATVYDEMYPEDKTITDPTDRRNSLNRFIAYHIINKQLSFAQFINAWDVSNCMVLARDKYEYIEPMLPNSLIEVKTEGAGSFATSGSLSRNTLFNYSTQRQNNISGSDLHCIQIVKTNSDRPGINGIYHEIDGLLFYDKIENDELSSKRLRFDAASLFPELTNNNMRGLPMGTINGARKCTLFLLPSGYVDRITSSEQTQAGYLSPGDYYRNYEGDEFYLRVLEGSGNLYKFSIVTPPVPKGTYEIRFGFRSNGNRGVAQLKIDGIPCGVPLNLGVDPSIDPTIGWVLPGTDQSDLLGFENDKVLRNKGYMKGPDDFTSGNHSGVTGRLDPTSVRKILGIYSFDTASTHILSVDGLSSGEFQFDFLEFIPTSAIETEDIN